MQAGAHTDPQEEREQRCIGQLSRIALKRLTLVLQAVFSSFPKSRICRCTKSNYSSTGGNNRIPWRLRECRLIAYAKLFPRRLSDEQSVCHSQCSFAGRQPSMTTTRANQKLNWTDSSHKQSASAPVRRSGFGHIRLYTGIHTGPLLIKRGDGISICVSPE